MIWSLSMNHFKAPPRPLVSAPAALSEPTHLMRPGARPEPLGYVGGLVTSGEWKPEEMSRNAGCTDIKITAAKSCCELKEGPGGSEGKASLCSVGNPGLVPGWRRSPGEGNGIHSSTLAWKIPWKEEPGRLQSMGSQRVGDVTFTFRLR